ncbi:MAG TPA: gamma-glutamyltransferase [Tepidisphaeraceae bacterium]|nr:gamma-glutamyltransferase [Tepidisphaeraceae bacterium]
MNRFQILCFICCLCVAGTGACQTSREKAPAGASDGKSASALADGQTIEVRHGAVVSVSGAASRVGRDVLVRGGNAVDAAVATAFVLAVTFPEAGNIGGGGFMVIYPGKGGGPVVVDYRETAPAAAGADTFAKGNRTQYRLVGVPGTVRGLALAHEHFGKLPWKDLVLPAVALAKDGFELNKEVAEAINEYVTKPGDEANEMRRVLGKAGGGMWAAGDRLVQPQLAETLGRIAMEGPSAFYQGSIADAIVESLDEGLITRADLAGYQAKLREPIHGTFRGFDLYAPPPPSSGGICLIEMLNMLEHLDLRENERWSAKSLHLMIETMRRGFVDRAKYLGDADFVSVPAYLAEKKYAAERAAQIDPLRATPSEDLATNIKLAMEGTQTTHFGVIDVDGMAVSNTYTLEQRFGGRVMVRGKGFLLNNEMGDFNLQPGVTDRQGKIGTKANQIAPGKRMLSSMAPVIVVKNGRVVMVSGSPGGRTIINTVLCVLLNRLEFEMSPRESVDAPRLTMTWFPDKVTAEADMHRDRSASLDELRRMGHFIDPKAARQGDAHSIFVEGGGVIIGVADKRRGGAAAGY